MGKTNMYFHFLKYPSHKYYDEKFTKGLEFINSLNLSDEQYKTLGELFELYGEQEREIGYKDGIGDETSEY